MLLKINKKIEFMHKNINKLALAGILIAGATLFLSVALAKSPNARAINGLEHKAIVNNVTQTLLKVSSKEPGVIGKQVQEIVQEQDSAKDATASAIDAIQNRNPIKTFLIGTDYKNVGQVRSEMVRTRNQINKIEQLIDNTTNPTTKTTLQEQLNTLGAEQQKIETFLKTNESKFSLFGWFFRLFNLPTPTTTTTVSSSTVSSTTSTATTVSTTTTASSATTSTTVTPTSITTTVPTTTAPTPTTTTTL